MMMMMAVMMEMMEWYLCFLFVSLGLIPSNFVMPSTVLKFQSDHHRTLLIPIVRVPLNYSTSLTYKKITTFSYCVDTHTHTVIDVRCCDAMIAIVDS
jgi:hypothetical protein